MSAPAPEVAKHVKKPFNKAAWREKKYSHGHKVEQWRDKQKLSMARNYQKMIRKDEKKAEFQNKGSKKENPNLEPIGEKKSLVEKMEDRRPAQSGYNRAKSKFEDKVASKQKKQEEILNRQKEKEEAIKKYKEKKAVKMKALSAKTRRGQPVMAGRIEMLLEQIQEQCKDD
eukprot:GFUD01042871.1.p1 GENE.GFUD01042871.1~~GFUD01042871.1.p1  ORF type:complete len:171 (+),score=77.40 GFUD01042871.1:53-565(+)